jgi:hypothetical protein
MVQSYQNEREILVLTKHGQKMKFYRKSRSGEGSTMSFIIVPLEVSSESVNAATNENRRCMFVGDLHCFFGHAAEANSWRNLKIDLASNMKVCEICDVSKARKKKISKENIKKLWWKERVYIDITTIYAVCIRDKKDRLLIVDEATDMLWSNVMTTKNDLILNFFREMKSKGTHFGL